MSDKLNLNCLKASLVVLFMLFLQTSFAQARFASLDKVIEEKKKQLGNNFSVTIAVADSVAFQKTVGDLPSKTPVPIGASSQWLTTALIMQLVDEGKLSLDDKVSKYLPVFESYRKGYITLRHCLSHQTGIGTDGFKLSSFLGNGKHSSLEEEINALAKKEIHANAGEQFRYSNFGITIAARVAEVVTKKRFDQIIRQKLFVPLTMRNTTFTTDDGSAPNPSGGAKSTAADYTKFLQMLLNGGKAGGKQILSEAAVAEMHKVQIAKEQITVLPKGAEGSTFALGSWVVEGSNTQGSTATTVALSNLAGIYPLIDFARGYSFVVFAKNSSEEYKPDLYAELKRVVDQQMPVKTK